MRSYHVDHAEIVSFADSHVNLKPEDVKSYREQAERLREKVEKYLTEHPEVSLKKSLISGSLAKGTALKDFDDIDLAVYVAEGEAPSDVNALIPWLAERIRKAFPNFKPEQVIENTFTVTVIYAISGLKVDVVPIFYSGDPEWRGHMVSKKDGTKILTSIPLHKEFVAKRKRANKVHYRQIVRLLKYWVKYQKTLNENFRFKSFMIELLVAHLADKGIPLDNYPEALAQIFAYIAKDGLKTTIAFDDYYDPSKCKKGECVMHIWDPVNHENNVASRYDEARQDAIVQAALDAGDAVDSAIHATSKSEALRHWRKVFGPAFDA